MGILSITLSIVSILCALLLTLVILVQNPKGSGGIGAIGGGVSEAMFGASAPSALVKITVILAVIFLAATLLNTAVVGHQRDRHSIGEQIVVEAAAEPAAPAAVPAEPAAPAVPAAE